MTGTSAVADGRIRRRLARTVAHLQQQQQQQQQPSSPAPHQPQLQLLLAAAGPATSLAQRLMQSSMQPIEAKLRGASGRSPVFGTHGMVASSQPLATEAGLRILQAGGNAVDAAIAVAAALAITTPAMTGLGGDMFMLFYDADAKTVKSLNGSGRCAAALTAERVRADLIAAKVRWAPAGNPFTPATVAPGSAMPAAASIVPGR